MKESKVPWTACELEICCNFSIATCVQTLSVGKRELFLARVMLK